MIEAVQVLEAGMSMSNAGVVARRSGVLAYARLP